MRNTFFIASTSSELYSERLGLLKKLRNRKCRPLIASIPKKLSGLVVKGTETEMVQDAIRIAAIMHAAAVTLDMEEAQ